jgi:hypothetical protein
MRFFLIVVLASALAACGGGDSDSGGSGGAVVFSLDPVNGPTCSNTDDIDEFTGTNGYMSVSCIWHCAPHFDGRNDVYVSISFENSRSTGGRWILDRKYLSDGIC